MSPVSRVSQLSMLVPSPSLGQMPGPAFVSMSLNFDGNFAVHLLKSGAPPTCTALASALSLHDAYFADSLSLPAWHLSAGSTAPADVAVTIRSEATRMLAKTGRAMAV